MNWEIRIITKSDATFGRGDGVSGLVDAEVEHDAYGFPFLRGRTLKGLLVEECANLLYALRDHAKRGELETAAGFLFGREGGEGSDAEARLSIPDACLPEALRDAVRYDLENNPAGGLTAGDILASLTEIRRQTAVDDATGAPARGSLRSLRVVLRETRFISPIRFHGPPDSTGLALLAACLMGLRRAGTGRNRGRGRLEASLWRDGRNTQSEHFARFKTIILERP